MKNNVKRKSTDYYSEQLVSHELVNTGMLTIGSLNERDKSLISIIFKSNLFNSQFYLSQNDDANLLKDEEKLLLHYFFIGFFEGKKPSFLFDPVYYMNENPDTVDVSIKPLLHYVLYGEHEGRLPSVFVDLEFLKKQIPQEIESTYLSYFYQNEINENLSAHPYFDVKYYLQANPDVESANVSPYYHFLSRGIYEGRRPRVDIDIEEYISDQNIDILVSHPFESFILFSGHPVNFLLSSEPVFTVEHSSLEINNNPEVKLTSKSNEVIISDLRKSGLVDSEWYLEYYSDLTGSSVDPVEHYFFYGWKENRNPNAYFDTKWFLKENDQCSGCCPLVYYMENWKDKKLNPSIDFDAQKYLKNNIDVEKSDKEPLSHYLIFGFSEGRESYNIKIQSDDLFKEYSDTGLFIDDWYSIVNEDLRGSGVNSIEHFILHGQYEGRKPNPYFDINWYKKKYVEDIAEESPLLFYAKTGWKLGHSPSPIFDGPRYREEYLNNENQEPLAHFLMVGKKEGFHPKSINEPRVSSGGLLKFDPEAKLTKDGQLRALIDNGVEALTPFSNNYSESLDIHWVMPDFAPGAGGHMTIFRTIRYLEIFGHKNTIWVYGQSLHETENEAYQDIIQHFQLVKAEVKFTTDISFKEARGDVVFATDWGSVSYVNSLAYFKRRFYFVQDHEPEFYAQGAYAIAAKNTYKFDLDCICASPWLQQLMEKKYGRWAREFWLSVDFDTYHLPEVQRNSGNMVKIAFYARHFTSRRAVELGFLALEALAEKGLDIEVHCFGAPLPFDTAPFKCIDHGVCNTQELAELYQTCDLGVVFSATNYSLIPQEMMACGIPVAELDVESTRAIFPDGVVSYLSTEPRTMADQLADLVENKEKRQEQAKVAYDWVSQFTWENAAKAVESALFKRLPELGFTKKEEKETTKTKASVIIPTWNAGEIFKKVVKKLQEQKAPWDYEVLVVDSGSSDGTIEFLKDNPDIKLHIIPNSEFQHGRTRNLAISMTKGDFIAVLTQDALPVDEYWLYDMVTSLEHYPNAAGAFGKHFAYDHADPYTKRDLINHFDNFEAYPYCVSKNTDKVKWQSNDISWRQFLHFYSDNNSILRRTVWEKIPYPEVKFGEDQTWALAIIEAGYEKVYCKHGTVYHSHDFDEGNVEKRAFEEAEFFRDNFGYIMVDSNNLDKIINDANEYDRQWGEAKRISKNLIDRRLKFNKAKFLGFNKANL